ncbi:MAG TPA: F0F1 ATP synthase subunit A [Polyangiaceae bacterium LLY-WYZ-14_1]|nr:F0F1 ATP synthase subunit A [Polyangiaceae bacterium LLY-WYZ-14_1]
MPHHETWLSVLLGSLYRDAEAAAQAGPSYLGAGPIGLQHVVGAVFVVLILVVVGLVVRGRLADPEKNLVPRDKLTVSGFVEVLVGATYDMMSQMMGAKAARYFLPLIGTCALFILFSNAIGLVPGFLPPTDNFNTTFACAMVIFFTTHIYGFREHGPGYLKHFFGPVRNVVAIPLMLLMFVIELISHAARPATLGIRLMANMTADHMVLGQFAELPATLISPAVWWLPIAWPMYFLGTIVVVVQTLVFCILSVVYISMAIEHEDH